jgi:hypothetical protein
MEAEALPSEVVRILQAAHGQFVVSPALSSIEGRDREMAGTLISASLGESIETIIWISAGLALAAAATGLLLPCANGQKKSTGP